MSAGLLTASERELVESGSLSGPAAVRHACLRNGVYWPLRETEQAIQAARAARDDVRATAVAAPVVARRERGAGELVLDVALLATVATLEVAAALARALTTRKGATR